MHIKHNSSTETKRNIATQTESGQRAAATLRKVAVLATLLLVTSCGTQQPKPQIDTSQEPPETAAPAEAASLSELDLTILEKAKQAINNGDLEAAEGPLKKLYRKYSGAPKVGINYATLLYKQSKFDEASKVLEALPGNTESIAAYYNVKGLLAVKQHRFVEAEKAYLKAIQLDAKFAHAHYNLALLYDIYYQNIEKAFLHYTQYLTHTDQEDQATKDWVEQLKYSLEL